MQELMTLLFPGVLTASQIAAVIVLSAWLIWEAVYDVKDQNIPLFFSIVPLLGAAAYWIANGQWQYAVLLMILVALTNLPSLIMGMVVCAVVLTGAFFYLPALFYPALAAFIFAFLLYAFGVMGGADALAIIYTTFWFPSWGTLVCLILGAAIYSSARLVLRDGKYAGLALWNRVKTMTIGSDRAPGLIGYALGILIYASVTLLLPIWM